MLDLVIEGRLVNTYGRVTIVALESAFFSLMSKTFPPRRFVLTALVWVSATDQRIQWWQIRPDKLAKGWELGRQPELLDEKRLGGLDPDSVCVSG